MRDTSSELAREPSADGKRTAPHRVSRSPFDGALAVARAIPDQAGGQTAGKPRFRDDTGVS